MEFALDEERPVYPALAALLGNDVCRVGVMLRAFHRMVGDNLWQMEHAVVAGELTQVRELTHRTAWGCCFIEKDRAADALDAVERPEHDVFPGDSPARTYRGAHGALVAVLDRAAAYAGVRTTRPAD